MKNKSATQFFIALALLAIFHLVSFVFLENFDKHVNFPSTILERINTKSFVLFLQQLKF